MDIEILKAVLSGLCASSEVSIRSPKSIAFKALQIVDEVEKELSERNASDEDERVEY